MSTEPNTKPLEKVLTDSIQKVMFETLQLLQEEIIKHDKRLSALETHLSGGKHL